MPVTKKRTSTAIKSKVDFVQKKLKVEVELRQFGASCLSRLHIKIPCLYQC